MAGETKISNKATLVLLKKFQEGQLKNSRWSQRAFARKLGLSSGALSEIFKGKRTLSPQVKKKIAPILQLSPFEQIDFFENEIPQNLKTTQLEYVQISTDQFHLISDWWNFAILNLIKTKGFKPEAQWIAERLGIPLKTAVESWEMLFRLGQLKRVNGKVVRLYPRIETTDGLFDVSIQKAHVEDAKLIEKSVLEVPLELRDHTSMTITLNRKNIKKAKELIRLFQDHFSEQVETTPADEVYRISVSLFPLTKITESL